MSKLLDISPIMRTDGYKFTHWEMFPPGVTETSVYLEPRGGKYGEIVVFGPQFHIEESLEGEVFTLKDVEELDYDLKHYFNPGWDGHSEVRNFFNKKGFTEMYESYGGRLPLHIKALPEGMVVPPKTMILNAVHTDPRFPWLPDYLEPILEKTWAGCTVATYSREFKKMLMKWWGLNGTINDIVFKLHGFGDRSTMSNTSSAYTGAAHLINFMGTDTFQATKFIQKYYYGVLPLAHSVPASEHLITMLWGKSKQLDLFKHLLLTYPGYIHSSVTDTWDHFKAISDDYKKLEPEIIKNNNTGGSLVQRPDTDIEEFVSLFELLFETFGTTNNRKGFKVSALGIKLLCGSSVSEDSADQLLRAMHHKGISIDNIVFGMGGNLDQNHKRDDCMFAFKGNNAVINGVDVPLFKDPITQKFKKSKKGRLIVVKDDNLEIETISNCDVSNFDELSKNDLMQTVLLNGEGHNKVNFSTIKDRAKII